MRQHSLRFRLLAAAVLSITAALLIAGASLVLLFEHHVERRIDTELETYLNQIIAGIGTTTDGRITFSQELADPRFNQPFSGLYWQIRDEERPTLLRSRSLWDGVIKLPDDLLVLGTIHEHTLPGPAGQELLVQERQIVFQINGKDHRLRAAVAIDKQSLIEARDAFASDMLPYLLIMVVVLLAASLVQVRIGLAPLIAVRRGVKEIRDGTKSRLEREYPEEVMPLVDEMNGLLKAQEQAIQHARKWTADLAHGLKTPLMALTADSQRLRKQGNTSMADDLDQLAETMRRRVDRELIRVRVRSGAQARQMRADCGEALDRVVRTLKRTPRGSDLEWQIQMPAETYTAIPIDDLTELLGAILDNAVKWAQATIAVSVSKGEVITLSIEDDGPGVPEDQLQSLGLRGVRLDERKEGSGLNGTYFS